MNTKAPSPRIVTRNEAEDFILSQDPLRPVNFEDYHIEHECGCVMVHLGKALGLNFTICNVESWEIHTKGAIREIAECEGWKHRTWGVNHATYETLQEEVLKKREQVKNDNVE